MENDKEIMQRRDAIKNGLTRYYTGKQCKYGHTTLRIVANGQCEQCYNERTQTRKAALIAKLGEAEATEYLRNEWKRNMNKWRAKNREHTTEYMRDYMREYMKTDVGQANANKARRKHEAANKDIIAAKAKAYRIEHKEEIAAKRRETRAKDPEKYRKRASEYYRLKKLKDALIVDNNDDTI